MSKSQGSIFDRGSPAQRELVAAVAQEYRVNAHDFHDMQEDRQSAMLEFVFARPPLLPGVKTISAKLRAMLNDPFRGPVILAATPEFAEEVKELLAVLGDNGPVLIRIRLSEVRPLLQKYLYGPFPNVAQSLSGRTYNFTITDDIVDPLNETISRSFAKYP